MTHNNEPDWETGPVRGRPRTPWAAHLVCYGLLCGLFVYVVVARYFQPLLLTEPIDVEPVLVQEVEQRVDPQRGPLGGVGPVARDRRSARQTDCCLPGGAWCHRSV